MCRMFGMAAAARLSPYDLLSEHPRSLRALSREHADGWGIAMHDGSGWRVERGTTSAAASERYPQIARHAARLSIAHVRKATVGETAVHNTHPFRRGEIVFAHNGTVTDVPALVAQSAPEHLARIQGDTDSERLFAFVLTHVDAARDVERGVCSAVRALRRLGDVGSASFLFATATQLYAHRAGRALFTTTRGDATMIASQPLDDGAWDEVAEGAVVALDTSSVHALAA